MPCCLLTQRRETEWQRHRCSSAFRLSTPPSSCLQRPPQNRQHRSSAWIPSCVDACPTKRLPRTGVERSEEVNTRHASPSSTFRFRSDEYREFRPLAAATRTRGGRAYAKSSRIGGSKPDQEWGSLSGARAEAVGGFSCHGFYATKSDRLCGWCNVCFSATSGGLHATWMFR